MATREILDDIHVEDAGEKCAAPDWCQDGIGILGEPVAEGSREAELCSALGGLGDPAPEGSPQEPLGGAVAILEAVRDGGAHGGHTGIQVRHPQLQRVRHGHAVGLGEDVAAKPKGHIDELHAPGLGQRIEVGVLSREHVSGTNMSDRLVVLEDLADLIRAEDVGIADVTICEGCRGAPEVVATREGPG